MNKGFEKDLEKEKAPLAARLLLFGWVSKYRDINIPTQY
jgi:hypothetical protein